MSKADKQFIEVQPRSLRENLDLIRANIFPVIIITLASLAFSIIYALNAVSIYKATSLIKITKPGGSILDSPIMPSFTDFQFDRFLNNEIEVIKSRTVREKVALALIDTFRVNKDSNFAVILDSKNKSNKTARPQIATWENLNTELKKVDIEAKRGIDFVEISFQSPSPYEATLVANCYADAYKSTNLEFNRDQLTLVRQFLTEQRDEKLRQLNQAEDLLKSFQEKGGVVALDQQANSLIQQLSNLESQRDVQKIEVMAAEKGLQKYRDELKIKAPQINAYLEKATSEEYIRSLQSQLAEYKLNKEIATSSDRDRTLANSQTLKEFDKKIKTIEDILKQKTEVLKKSIFSTSPDEVRDLTQKIFLEDLRIQSAKASIDQLNNIVKKYETKFNLLPKTSIEFARLQRNRESIEKLYFRVEEKYQESVMNEKSQPGNVLIVDAALIPTAPSKPNRTLIIAVGFFLGLGIAFGYVFLRNYFDNTVKTPDDIQKLNTNVLSWIPQIEGIAATGSSEFEFIVAKKPDSIPSESFRALRTRVQFSRVDTDSLKTILITSSAPSEGKTIICTNLAGSFALSNKKTVILDCDLRKPRIHSFFKTNRYPGLVDYLFGQVPFDDIVRNSEIPDLFYITAGTIPPNPSEILESQKMKDFIAFLRSKYDYVLLDSPPIIAVTDSEILARIADATALIVSANTTEIELMMRSLEIIRQDNINFIGTILNNFVYKSSYGSYYKYYYYYTRPRKTDRSKLPPPTQSV